MKSISVRKIFVAAYLLGPAFALFACSERPSAFLEVSMPEQISSNSSASGDGFGKSSANSAAIIPGASSSDSQPNPISNPSDNPPPNVIDIVKAPLLCDTNPLVLKSGQSREFVFTNPNSEVLNFRFASPNMIGSLEILDINRVKYTAPASIPDQATILILGFRGLEPSTNEAFCEATLIPDSTIVIPDDNRTDGLVGNVYRVPEGQPMLPEFSTLTPVASVIMSNFDVPVRAFEAGFPGVDNLVEWFAISFSGFIEIPSDGEVEFSLNADDGANFYIDDVKVIDNDGIHAPRTKTGIANLSAGLHRVRMDYYQGPRYHIALQLSWRKAGQGEFSIVPAEAFSRDFLR